MRPDLGQLRAALVHCPTLAGAFLKLHRIYQSTTEQLLSLGESGGEDSGRLVAPPPEAAVHNFFRRNRNHFRELEEAAGAFWEGVTPRDRRDLFLSEVPAEEGARHLGPRRRRRRLAEHAAPLRRKARAKSCSRQALDHPNRVFQLVHVMGLLTLSELLDSLLARSEIVGAREHGALPGGAGELLRRRRADAL